MTKFCVIKLILLCCVSVCVHTAYAEETDGYHDNADFANCAECHTDIDVMMKAGAMMTLTKEKAFIDSTFTFDKKFSEKNCSGCHVADCADCHTLKDKKITTPDTNTCLNCHNGGFTGMDYTGRGIREDHERYQRGLLYKDTYYQKMLPDVHFEKGLTCADCHSMKSMAGKEKAKQCADCHKYDRKIIDHSIKGHDKVACVSCHAAWAPMELGIFYVRFRESPEVRDYFKWIKPLNEEYYKSSFMRVNDLPPLAIDNETGLYVPVRPSFIVFYTDIYKDLVIGRENRMLSNEYKTFTPHTIRRETVLCQSCHSDRKRYLVEKESERILYPDKDGLPFKSFYNSNSFALRGGKFVTEDEYLKISEKTPLYYKLYMKKLEQVKMLLRSSAETK